MKYRSCKMDREGRDRHLARLDRTKATRDAGAWTETMSKLEAASREPRENTMPYIIDAVRADATVGEICGLWRRVFGEYPEIVAV